MCPEVARAPRTYPGRRCPIPVGPPAAGTCNWRGAPFANVVHGGCDRQQGFTHDR